MPPNSTDWSDDELQHLPQTTAVFDQPPLVIDNHKWIQQGYLITDNCQPKRPDCPNAGIPIPPGKTLVEKGGKHDLVPEGSR